MTFHPFKEGTERERRRFHASMDGNLMGNEFGFYGFPSYRPSGGHFIIL